MELDDLGYPTEDTLKEIENWSVADDVYNLPRLVAPLFEGYGKFAYNDKECVWQVATGGWSGCEDIINALQRNHVFWGLCWMLSKRGGYYEFKGYTVDGVLNES